MACQGPTGPTEEDIDRAMELVMEALGKEFGVKDPIVHPAYMRVGKDGERLPPRGNWLTMGPLEEKWFEARGKLRDAVREMLFSQSCNDW